ncbi:MAG: hypothetical protein II713_03075, partial [Clostridia bacterium]|nr:hypothetical protein [Clostridia bacterium]
FGKEYLDEIRFRCLAMSEEYIKNHFDRIVSHASDAEKRLDDSDLTPESLLRDNRAVTEGFRAAGEIPLFPWENPDEMCKLLEL